VNYIQQMNSFWDKLEVDQDLKATPIAVYSALFQINNRTGWKVKFRATYGQVLSMIGITKNTYYAAVDALVKGGYIEYEKGPNQYQAATFKMIVLNQILVQQEESTRKALGIAQVHQEESTGNILKQPNSKTTKHIKQETFINDFIEPQYEFVFNEWIKYKKDKGQGYKNAGSVLMAYNNLKKLSGNNPEAAKEIIENSIGNNYAGFFALRNNQVKTSTQGPGRGQQLINQRNAIKFQFDNE
jgi:hypothetical protein